jgi:hypothetical protein
MKIADQRGFWSLRPTLTARGLEFGCWLAAALLAVTLAISPTSPTGPPALPIRTIGVLHAPDLLAYRQHCVDRVLASDIGMTEEYVVRQINRQCSTRQLTAARPVVLTCSRPFVGQVTPLARRVPGCPGG